MQLTARPVPPLNRVFRLAAGEQMLQAENITLHSIFTISEVLECLKKTEKISEKMVAKVRHWFVKEFFVVLDLGFRSAFIVTNFLKLEGLSHEL